MGRPSFPRAGVVNREERGFCSRRLGRIDIIFQIHDTCAIVTLKGQDRVRPQPRLLVPDKFVRRWSIPGREGYDDRLNMLTAQSSRNFFAVVHTVVRVRRMLLVNTAKVGLPLDCLSEAICISRLSARLSAGGMFVQT